MRLIDADALVKEISVSHTMTDDCGIKIGYEISMRLVEDAPTIEPRPRGRWIERWHDNQHVIGDMACSVCGAQMLLTFPRFCPCCGAYMREEAQDD